MSKKHQVTEGSWGHEVVNRVVKNWGEKRPADGGIDLLSQGSVVARVTPGAVEVSDDKTFQGAVHSAVYDV